jgi:hypothetical protein
MLAQARFGRIRDQLVPQEGIEPPTHAYECFSIDFRREHLQDIDLRFPW